MKTNRNFTLILFGQIISLFGNSIQRFSLSLYILDLTGNASIYGNILALSILPYIFLAPIAGIIADNYNKKYMMIILDVVSGILLLLFYTCLIYDIKSVIIIALVMILLSAISSCYNPVVTACIPQVVQPENLHIANSYVSQVNSWSNILGPVLGGVFYGLFGIKIIIIFNAISFLFSAILEYFIKIPKTEKPQKKSLNLISSYSHMINTWKILRKKHITTSGIILSYCMYNICIVPINSILLPTIMNLYFNISSKVYGIIEGIIAGGMLFSGFLITLKPKWFNFKIHYKWNYLMPISILFMGTLLLIIPKHFLNIITITLGGIIIMFCLGIGNIITLTYIQTSVPSKILGSVSALSTAVATASVPVGQVIFGYLMESNINIGIILIFSSIISLLVCNYVKWNIKRDEL